MRSLRLNKRFEEAQAAYNALASSLPQNIKWLDKEQDIALLPQNMKWLDGEQEKLTQTMHKNEEGDAYYRNGDYKKAADVYESVLLIDEGISVSLLYPWEFVTAGGKLHAALHCRRAACLMALGKFDEAAKECGAALQIEDCYLKAMCRRARCYVHLERYDESISDYNHWFALVNKAKNVKDGDYEKVVAELNDVKTKKAAKEESERQRAKTETSERKR